MNSVKLIKASCIMKTLKKLKLFSFGFKLDRKNRNQFNVQMPQISVTKVVNGDTMIVFAYYIVTKLSIYISTV